MRLAKFQNFQKRHKQGYNFLFVRRFGKKFLKAGLAKQQAAFNGFHTAFHGKVITLDGTQAEVDFRRFSHYAVLYTQKRFPQRFQR